MDPVLSIILLWLGFALSHIVLSSVALRPRLVGVLGGSPFAGVYSLVAFAFFVPLIWIYFANTHAGPWLWEPIGRGPVGRWAIYVAMASAFTLVIAGAAKPSPASIVPGAATATGVHRITRHPLVMGIALFGLAHLLPNGSAADVAFFGGFVAFALVGSYHQDLRKLAVGPDEFKPFYANTRFLPFAGPNRLQGLREIPWWTYAAGVVAATLLRQFHATLFGA